MIPAVTQWQLQIETLYRSSKEASVKCSGCWRVGNSSLLFLSYRMVYWWMNLDCQRSLQHKRFKSTVDTMELYFSNCIKNLFYFKILENLSFQYNLNITTSWNAIRVAGGVLSLEKVVLLLNSVNGKFIPVPFSGSSQSDRF